MIKIPLLQRLFYNFLFLIIAILGLMPTIILRIIGFILGTIGYNLVTHRRNVGLINLSLCFPAMKVKQKKQIIKAHFRYLITAVLEYGIIFYASKKRIKKLVQLKNFHYLTDHYQQQPIILLAPHFVGLDIGVSRLSLEIAGTSIFSQQKNQYLTKKIQQKRTRFMAKTTRIFSRAEGLRSIIKYLKQENKAFYYLPDQDFGERDSVFVPFFAHPTCATITTLAKLVKLTKAIVIPMMTYAQGNHYVVEFFPYWENYPSENQTPIDEVTKMNQAIETMINSHIAQYYWLHKRFKTQPDGRHKLYQSC